VYSSQDLVHWTFRNMIATPQTKLSIPTSKNVVGTYFSDMKTLGDATWIGRLGVVYNENTGKYVMLSQMENKDPTRATNASIVFLEGDSPTDDFTYANIQTQIQNAPQQGTGDQTVFTDSDGTDYLLFSNRSGRSLMFLSKLDPADSLSIQPGVQISRNSAGREGNAMFKIGDTYYAAASDLHGYNSSVAYVVQSLTSNPQGAYSPEYVLPGTQKDYSHVTQTGFFFTVHGTKQDTVVFAGDRWADFAWNGIGYNQWMPLSGSGSNVSFNSVSSWDLNAQTGEWKTGDANNYVLNPNIDADRVAVTSVTGWTNQVDASSVAKSLTTNPSPGADGSHYALRLGASTAFSGSVYQDITLPDGLYRFSLKDQTAGGLDSAKVVVTGGPGQSYTLDLGAATSGFTAKSISELKISGGSARVTFQASGAGGKSVTIDSMSLVKEAVDRSDLQSLVTAEKVRTSAGVNAATWATYSAALTSAEGVLADPTATQAEIDAADASLAAAVAGLVPAVVSVTAQAATTSYGVGDAFDTSGLTVTATRADGSTEQLSGDQYTVEGFSSAQAGSETIHIVVDPSLTGVNADPVSAAVSVNVYALWAKGTAYKAGAQVWYAGSEWLASWRTQGEQPGDPNGAWQEIRTDAAGVAIWTPSRTFNAGDVVDFGGVTYKADWWTRNEKPGDPNGPWEEIRTDAAGVAIWTPSRVFTAGDIVDYNGVTYKAKWWTRDEQPGDPKGPWQLVG
jgi:chitodextrinase